MASSRILSSKAVNKLQVNRLDAQAIRSDNIIVQNPSYLFSAVFNNGNFSRDSTGGTLTFTRSDFHSIIQFSDRPFRQTDNIDFESFVSLFGISDSGSNTFAQDPPNGVLVHEEEQRTYIIRLLNSDTDSVTFSLELLPGESHKLTDVNGRMSLFVDDDKSSSTEVTIQSINFQYDPLSQDSKTMDNPLYQRNELTSITFSKGVKNFQIKTGEEYNKDIFSNISLLGKRISISGESINPFFTYKDKLDSISSNPDQVSSFYMYPNSVSHNATTDTGVAKMRYNVNTPFIESNSLKIQIHFSF